MEAEVRRILSKPTRDIYLNELSSITSINLTNTPDAARGIEYIGLTGFKVMDLMSYMTAAVIL